MVDSNTQNPRALLPETLLSKSGVIKNQTSNSKLLGLYFSAHWCPPCKAFTPILAEAYMEWKEKGRSIEIVFISSDRDDKEFQGYYNEMPWLAIELSNKDAVKLLKNRFDVKGIPFFVILDENGNVVDNQARASVTNYGPSAIVNWEK